MLNRKDAHAKAIRERTHIRPHDADGLREYLFGRAEADELDGRGCFSHESCENVEANLLRLAQPEVEAWAPPHLPATARYLDRWRFASGMQKAIRFCLPEAAMVAASQLYAADKSYALARLGVIAVEDVMAGNPIMVARVLAMLGKPAWRSEVDERRLVIWAAHELARSSKDRSAVELNVLVDHDPALDPRPLAWANDDDLAGIIAGHGPVLEQQAAAHVMAGPTAASDAVKGLPGSHKPGDLFALMPGLHMTRWSMYVAAKIASRLRDNMWLSMPIIDRWMRRMSSTVVPGPEFPKPMIGDVLGAAYDKYTRPGIRATYRFMAEPAIAALLKSVAPPKRRMAIGVWIFVGEGGTLAERIVTDPESEHVHRWARSPERMFWMPRDLAPTAVPTLLANLERLNEIRADVVWSDES